MLNETFIQSPITIKRHHYGPNDIDLWSCDNNAPAMNSQALYVTTFDVTIVEVVLIILALSYSACRNLRSNISDLGNMFHLS